MRTSFPFDPKAQTLPSGRNAVPLNPKPHSVVSDQVRPARESAAVRMTASGLARILESMKRPRHRSLKGYPWMPISVSYCRT